MARNAIHAEATPKKVFAVLSDPASYAEWVVGSREVRAADSHWPAAGSRFHHTIGLGPLAIKDHTSVERVDPPGRLVLCAKTRPFGIQRISLQLRKEGRGTRIVMEEEPVEGPAAWVHNRLFDLLLHARNAEALRRLKRLAERG